MLVWSISPDSLWNASNIVWAVARPCAPSYTTPECSTTRRCTTVQSWQPWCKQVPVLQWCSNAINRLERRKLRMTPSMLSPSSSVIPSMAGARSLLASIDLHCRKGGLTSNGLAHMRKGREKEKKNLAFWCRISLARLRSRPQMTFIYYFVNSILGMVTNTNYTL